jgi:hypothetical protein
MTPFTPEMILQALKAGPKTYDEIAPPLRRARQLSGVYELTESMIKAGKIEKFRAGNNQWVLTLPGFVGSKAELEYRIAPFLQTDGECLIWTGTSDPVRGPMIHWNNMAVPVRRLLWTLNGRDLTSSQSLRCRCEEHNCLRLGHLRKENRVEVLIGKPLSLVHKKRIAETKRKKSNISQETVNQIRSSDQSLKQLAALTNVPISTVAAIRCGRLHKEYRTNPFSGLLPSNYEAKARA